MPPVQEEDDAGSTGTTAVLGRIGPILVLPSPFADTSGGASAAPLAGTSSSSSMTLSKESLQELVASAQQADASGLMPPPSRHLEQAGSPPARAGDQQRRTWR